MVVMQSCCCCGTRTGAKIIGFLYLLFTALIIAGLAVTFYYYDLYVKPILNEALRGEGVPDAALTKASKTVSDVFIASLVLKSFYFLLCLLMLIGTFKENNGYILPWVIADFVRQLLFIAAFVGVAWRLTSLVNSEMLGIQGLALYCIVCLVIICLTFYFWLAVIGAYQSFKDEDKVVPLEYDEDYPGISSSMDKFAQHESLHFE